MTQRRSRGRPRAHDVADRRNQILDVARTQFAAHGFAGASMRAIAREAGVDPSLISHYFGDKAGLLVATMELPVDPVAKIASVIEGGPDGLAERLVRTFLGAWDPHREVFSTLVRTTLGAGAEHAPMVEIARNVLVARLLDVLDGDDRELRATLVAGQLIGMAVMRYVLRLPPLADAPADEVVSAYAPAVQRLVDGA